MQNYDVIIVGGATSGSYFAKLLAEQGKKVLVLEQNSPQNVGSKYDIFHIPKKDFATFGVPMPAKGDDDWAFEFNQITSLSSQNKYPKTTTMAVVGLHMHQYVLRLLNWAQSFGAQVMYNAQFTAPIYQDGKVVGVQATVDGAPQKFFAKLVADCSGIASAVRRSLKEDGVIERFPITGEDMFYVVLRYVNYPNPDDYITGNRGWLYYKTWEAPQPNPHGAILGIGANFSFDYAEKMWRQFTDNVQLPPYELEHIERGFTPFRRPPYSFVDDGVIVMGDSACLTKPFNGEGVTSSWVQTKIAFDVINQLLDDNKPLSRDNLWPINVRYIAEQGAKFASSLATATGAIATNAHENNYFYKHNIVFSQKTFQYMNDRSEMYFSGGDIFCLALKMLWGVLTFNIRPKTIKLLLKAMSNGDKIKKQYLAFPQQPDGFDDWVNKTEKIWQQIGTVADTVPVEERS